MSAQVIDFHIARTRRRPFADFELSALHALLQQYKASGCAELTRKCAAEIARRQSAAVHPRETVTPIGKL